MFYSTEILRKLILIKSELNVKKYMFEYIYTKFRNTVNFRTKIRFKLKGYKF